MQKNSKGFTYVELIVATVILAIVVAGVYAAFLSAAKFTGFFKHEVISVIGEQYWLDRVYAENRFSDLTDGGTGNIDLTDPAELPPWQQLQGEVETLYNPGYVISDPNDPNNDVEIDGVTSNDFKRITITVQWDERQI